jgi:prophage antirepressor-like protein
VNDEIHFIAKDVAEKLGYTWNGGQRVEHVPEEWKGGTSVVTQYGTQEVITLSEQGLYFFLGRSDKPAALPFQKWIAGEIIPSMTQIAKELGMSAIALALEKKLHEEGIIFKQSGQWFL